MALIEAETFSMSTIENKIVKMLPVTDDPFWSRHLTHDNRHNVQPKFKYLSKYETSHAQCSCSVYVIIPAPQVY